MCLDKIEIINVTIHIKPTPTLNIALHICRGQRVPVRSVVMDFLLAELINTSMRLFSSSVFLLFLF